MFLLLCTITLSLFVVYGGSIVFKKVLRYQNHRKYPFNAFPEHKKVIYGDVCICTCVRGGNISENIHFRTPSTRNSDFHSDVSRSLWMYTEVKTAKK